MLITAELFTGCDSSITFGNLAILTVLCLLTVLAGYTGSRPADTTPTTVDFGATFRRWMRRRLRLVILVNRSLRCDLEVRLFAGLVVIVVRQVAAHDELRLVQLLLVGHHYTAVL